MPQCLVISLMLDVGQFFGCLLSLMFLPVKLQKLRSCESLINFLVLAKAVFMRGRTTSHMSSNNQNPRHSMAGVGPDLFTGILKPDVGPPGPGFQLFGSVNCLDWLFSGWDLTIPHCIRQLSPFAGLPKLRNVTYSCQVLTNPDTPCNYVCIMCLH